MTEHHFGSAYGSHPAADYEQFVVPVIALERETVTGWEESAENCPWMLEVRVVAAIFRR